MRRAAAVLTAAVAAAALLPGVAEAHGLVQRQQLPIPWWLLFSSAAAVLVISFFALAVLSPKPWLEEQEWRPMPGGRLLAGAPVQALCGALGVGLLAVTILAGYLGPENVLDNWAPTFVMIIFWVGLVFASILFGDVFKAFSPWRALGRLLPQRRREYPEKLGRWPAAVGLFVFVWIELVSGWAEDPALLATAIAGYTLLTLIAQAVYGVETWTERGEAFAVYFNLFARLSIFETRDGVVGVRRPLGGLPSLERMPGTLAVTTVMIGTVSFDGLSQGELWQDVSRSGVDALGFLDTLDASRVMSTLGLLFGVALIAAFYRLGSEGAHTVSTQLSRERLESAFVHSLIPIAAVYVAAHYLTFLVFEGQAIAYLASDPFNQHWDLFGTASTGINYTVFPQGSIWYVQVGLVMLGHVAALALAHDRALVLYGDSRLAMRSQVWMLGVMVGFTSLALWLLTQAGA